MAAVITSKSKGGKGAAGSAEMAELSVSDYYSRLVVAEKDLIAERVKRGEVEAHLTKILRDIDAKAPLISAQKRDMNRIIESHSHLTLKLDNLTVEHDELKESYANCTNKFRDVTEHSSSQEKMIVDLSSQIQHLLRKGYESMPHLQRPAAVALVEQELGATSASPWAATPHSIGLNITFDDIADLQSRNAYLLKAVHKLSQENARLAEISSGRHISTGGQSQAADPAPLLAAREELDAMREARKKTEELVKVLVQQRDLYRSILDNNGNVDVNAIIPYINSATTKGNAGHAVAADAALEIENLNFKIKQHETESKHHKERLSRLETAETLLLESLDQAKKECSELRLKSAESSNDARFHRERLCRSEESIKAMQLDIVSTNQRKEQLEEMVRALERDSFEKNSSLMATNEKMRRLDSDLRTAQAEAEVARAAEQRLQAQLTEQREEIKNQVALGDSIRRIEAGLSSQMEEEKLAAVAERDSLARDLESFRKHVAERGIIDEERTRQLDVELRTARETLDSRTAELTDFRAEVLVEQGELRAVTERAALLEKQLALANDRLSAVMGAQILDSAKASENAQKEALLEQANKQIESLTSQLLKATESSEHYFRISTSTEALLADVQQKTTAVAASHEERVKALVEELAAAQRDLSSFRLKSLHAVQAEENMREQLRNATREFNEKVALCEETSSSHRVQQEAAIKEAALLKAEVAKQQQMTRASHANYERELQLHARAEKALRELQEESDRLKEQLSVAEVAVRALEVSQQQQVPTKAVAQVAALLQESSGLKLLLDEQRARNDALHTSVKEMEAQVQQRAVSLAAEDAMSSVEESGVGDAEGARVSELKGLSRQLRIELDIQSKKLVQAQGEATAAGAELAAAQRSLDESKVQLQQRAAEVAAANFCSRQDYERLLGEAQQLQLIRESNSHLRAENDSMSKQLLVLREVAKASKDKVAPYEEKIRVLANERDALLANNSTLATDASYWRERLHQLVSQYNEVDPVEHRQLQTKLQEVQKVQEKTVADYETTISEYDERLARVSSELCGVQERIAQSDRALAEEVSLRGKVEEEVKSLKATNEGLDKSNTKFRNLCREFKDKITENTKKLAELMKKEEEARAEGAALAEEVAQLKRAAPTAAAAAVGKPSVQQNKALPPKPAPVSADSDAAMDVELAPAVAAPAAAAAAPAVKRGAKKPPAKAAQEAPVLEEEQRVEPVEVVTAAVPAVAAAKKVAKKTVVAKAPSPAKETPVAEETPAVDVAPLNDSPVDVMAVEAPVEVVAAAAPAVAAAKKVAKKTVVAKAPSPAKETPVAEETPAAETDSAPKVGVGRKRKQPTSTKAPSPVAEREVPVAIDTAAPLEVPIAGVASHVEAPVALETAAAAPAAEAKVVRRRGVVEVDVSPHPDLETAPVDAAPMGKAPADDAPVETFPVDVVPVDEAPAETAPAAGELDEPVGRSVKRRAEPVLGLGLDDAEPSQAVPAPVAAVAAASMKSMKETLLLKRKKAAEAAPVVAELAAAEPASESAAASAAKRARVEPGITPAAAAATAGDDLVSVAEISTATLLAAENSKAFSKTFFGEKKPLFFGGTSAVSAAAASPFGFGGQAQTSSSSTPFKGFGVAVGKEASASGGHIFGSTFGTASPFGLTAAPVAAWGSNANPSPKSNPFGAVFGAVGSIFGSAKKQAPVSQPVAADKVEDVAVVEDGAIVDDVPDALGDASMLVEEDVSASSAVTQDADEAEAVDDIAGTASLPPSVAQIKKAKEKMTAEQLKALRLKRAARFNAEKDAEQG